MKKVTATILLKGESKTVTVMLDDTTYTLLKQAGDRELFLQYVTEEYVTGLKERAETRRHKSLDYLMDKGLEFEDERQDLFETVALSEDAAALKEALKILTERQRDIVLRHVVEGQSLREIARALGLHKDTVREHFSDGIKKLQEFFKKYPAKT